MELLDEEHVDLVRVTGARNFIVSDAITSRLMTQLAAQPERGAVLLALYADDGPSLGLVPVGDLGLRGAVGWDEIIVLRVPVGLLVIGWRSGGDVVLNPATASRMQLRDNDQIVVIG